MQIREIQKLNREIRSVVQYEMVLGQDDDAFERACSSRVLLATIVPRLQGVLGTARARRI